jgi:hypothetical protein
VMIIDVEGCEGYDDTVVEGRYGLNTAGQDGNAMGDVRAFDESFVIGFALGQSCEATRDPREKGGRGGVNMPFPWTRERSRTADRKEQKKSSQRVFQSGTPRSPHSLSRSTLHQHHEAPA